MRDGRDIAKAEHAALLSTGVSATALDAIERASDAQRHTL